jgi:hypothetical protein
MSVTSAVVAVGASTPVQLAAVSEREGIVYLNGSINSLRIGGPGLVGTADGFDASSYSPLTLRRGDELWGISNSGGTINIQVLVVEG